MEHKKKLLKILLLNPIIIKKIPSIVLIALITLKNFSLFKKKLSLYISSIIPS